MKLKIYLLLITLLFGISLLSYYLINNIQGFNKYNLKIVPIKPCGCEITNLNLADRNYYLDNGLVKYLEFLMAKYGFILIRNQGKINNEKNIKGLPDVPIEVMSSHSRM